MFLIAVLFGSVLASLIPAGVVKLLLWTLFQRTAAYPMILLVMTATYVVMSIGLMAMGFDSEDSFETMSDALTIGVGTATILFQAILLAIVVTDQDDELIGVGRWMAALLLQYGVYLGIGLIFIFA